MNFDQELLSIEKQNPDKAIKLRGWLNSFFWYVGKEGSNIERGYPNVKRGSILFTACTANFAITIMLSHFALALRVTVRLQLFLLLLKSILI